MNYQPAAIIAAICETCETTSLQDSNSLGHRHRRDRSQVRDWAEEGERFLEVMEERRHLCGQPRLGRCDRLRATLYSRDHVALCQQVGDEPVGGPFHVILR